MFISRPIEDFYDSPDVNGSRNYSYEYDSHNSTQPSQSIALAHIITMAHGHVINLPVWELNAVFPVFEPSVTQIPVNVCPHHVVWTACPLQWCVINLSKCWAPLGSITKYFPSYRHFAETHVNSHQARSIFTGFLWTQLVPFIKFLNNSSWGTELLVWIDLPWGLKASC